MCAGKVLGNEKLLVVGSLNWNSADRELDRADVKTVQLFSGKEFEPVSFFDSWGELGVGSFAAIGGSSSRWFASTGDDLSEIDLSTGEVSRHEIEGLSDVHDIDFIDGCLWLSNTGKNEAIAYEIDKRSVIKRIYLNPGGLSNYRNPDAAAERIDHFHLNQVFNDLSGSRCVLVHNTNGKQYLKRIAGKVIKSQGAGGIISLESNQEVELNLRAPHHVRIIRNQYWVCNSGQMMVNIFNRDWSHAGSFATKGFGRGFAVSENNNIAYIGTSKTRKRYAGIIPSGMNVPNMIQAFNIQDKSLVLEVEVPSVEQLNNLYILDDQQYERFRRLN